MSDDKQTKKCPFCAETILAEAVKCRHCAEYLFDSRNGEPRNPLAQQAPAAKKDKDAKPDFCYLSGPSSLAGIYTYFKSALIIGLSIYLYNFPFEDYLVDKSLGQFVFTSSHAMTFGFYRQVACVSFIVLAILISIYKILQLKATDYEVTPDRIEWTRGLFSRKIDNIDMFRIVDIKLHRSLVDCLFGIGTVTIITKDETQPTFMFYKVRSPKKLYNILKNSYLDADRKQGVIHLD